MAIITTLKNPDIGSKTLSKPVGYFWMYLMLSVEIHFEVLLTNFKDIRKACKKYK